jgi:tetratricopeptide (TPR) repeat protein
VVARALALAQCGRRDEARARLDAAAPRLPEAERDSEWLPMMAQAAEVLGAVGQHPVAEYLYDALLPYRELFAVEGIGAATRGSVERHLGIAAAAVGRQADAIAHFDAAVAANTRLGATLLVARTLRDAGVALDDSTRLRDARAHYHALGADRRVAEIDVLLGPSEPVAPSVATGNVFTREGEMWRIAYAGREVRLRDSKGLRDLAVLLAEPGRPVPAVTLLSPATVGRRRSTAAADDDLHEQGDLGEVVDRRARDAYRRRLADLEEEIDDADRAGDPERSARAAAEKDALVDQLAAAFGLGGRPRRAGDPAERARQTVSARVRDVLVRIEAVHPELGRHLRRSVRTGRLCVYEPDTPVEWRL